MKVEPHRLVVIDTNVWLSAALNANGVPASVVRAVLRNARHVLSPETFAELRTRLWKPKFDRYIDVEMRQRLLHDIECTAMWVDIAAPLQVQRFSQDRYDDAFVHAALAAGANCLVSGDQDLLAMAPVPGLRVLTPAQALTDQDFPRIDP